MKLKNYFDRVVLLNLKRRPDRLARTQKALRGCQWPFKQPEVVEAVDGLLTTPRPLWKHGPGAWGCLQSHHRVLTQAMQDGVKNVLILEDDICFAENFRDGVEGFLRRVPDDWDQLMLGGQHVNHTGDPILVKEGIVRCADCERTHCYAIQGEFMRKLAARWLGGGKFDGLEHCDRIMGRDPEMQFAHKVYAPEYFLVGQDREDESDICGTGLPRKFWNPPGPDMCVVNLHAPANVVSALRYHGLCTGDGLHRKGDLGEKLKGVFADTKGKQGARIRLLRDWIKLIQWELAAEPLLTCTIWHPEATPELVRAASLWPVYEVTASSVAEAVKQLPPELRRLHRERQQGGFAKHSKPRIQGGIPAKKRHKK